jgi:hypothetical protein
MYMSEELLRSIDAKLGALLAIEVNRFLKETPGTARAKERPIDVMLAGVGLKSKEIAALLGKTERGVNLVLQKSGKGSRAPRKKKR